MIKLVLDTINILILIKCVFIDSRPMYVHNKKYRYL